MVELLRLPLGETRRDKIRNEWIRGTTLAEQFLDKVRNAKNGLHMCRGGMVDILDKGC